MNTNAFPTKGNLMLAKNSLTLAKQGYELMDKKRNILIRELMNLIEEATAKIKENPNPQEAMKIMAETSKNIDKCCEENGITLSDWKKNLSDDLKKKYEEATAKFLEACEKIK